MAGASQAATSSLQTRLANVRYAEKDYWDTRYKSQPCEFDWFYGYTALRKIVRTFVKRSKLVLHVGCGNSNFQEGMAKDGYQVVNTDISEVVVEQMRAKHQSIASLRYAVSDCRNMPEFLDCQFGTVIDKGTVDALLCSKDAADSIRSMFREISRVLVPGGVFLLITLGGPAQRLSLVNQPEFDWSVQVCLVRRVPEDRYAPSAPGRPIPLNDTAKSLSYIGPLEVQHDGTVAGLPEPFDPSNFFYAYVCRRSPLVLPRDNQCGAGGKVRLPEGWRATVKAVAEVVGGELKLPQGILGRGRRVKMASRASFEQAQRERELEWERERARQRIQEGRGDSASQLQLGLLATLRNQALEEDQEQSAKQVPQPQLQLEQQQQRASPHDGQPTSGNRQGAQVAGGTGGDGYDNDTAAADSTRGLGSRDLEGVRQGGAGEEAGTDGRGREGEHEAGREGRTHHGTDPRDLRKEEISEGGVESLLPLRDAGPAAGDALLSAGSSADSTDMEQWESCSASLPLSESIAAAAMGPSEAETESETAAAPPPLPLPPPPAGDALRNIGEDFPHPRPPRQQHTLNSVHAISYRRLSATVQDAFAVLDAVDGTGCSSGCSNSLLDTGAGGPNDMGSRSCLAEPGQEDKGLRGWE